MAAAVAILVGAAVLVLGRRTERTEGGASAPATSPSTAAAAPATSSTTAPPSPYAAVAGKTVLIDPGHNGANGTRPDIVNAPVDIGTQERACDTTGASTNDGYTESAYNLDIALRVTELLRAAGAEVVLTRTDDAGVGPCIDGRAAIGNLVAADAAVSIHADGGPPDGRGFHLIFPPSIPGLTDDIAAESRELALDLRAAFQEGTGMPYADYIASEGLSERSDLGGTNLSNVPKVFIETGNMRNDLDAALMHDEGFRQAAAGAIADGIARYLAGA